MTTMVTKRHLFYQNLRKISVVQVLVYSILLITVIVSMFPMVMMIINSFKSTTELYSNPGGLPLAWTLQNYGDVFSHHTGLWRNFLVGVIVASVSTVVSLFFCSLAAFAFAKYRFWGRNILFALLLAMMMIPQEITIPGKYLIFARFGWLDTILALILPNVTPILGLFLIRQYMLEIPDALIDAARIDGAGHFTVFWRIIAPVSSPILGAYAILHYLAVWNQYTWPSVAVRSPEVQPLMIVLPSLVDPISGMIPVWGTIMAGCVLATIPIIIVFLIFQDTFMSSMVIGAVKE